VRYFLEMHDVSVRPFFDRLEAETAGLGEEVTQRLLDDLAAYGDVYRGDTTRRLWPARPDLFEYGIVFGDAGGRWRSFRFIVSDAAAVHGVLTLVFAEELTVP
jgi:hypothetical protein